MLPPLPNGATAHAVQLDAAGNIYLAGSVPQNGGDAFVAKLSPDGSQILYWTVLSGSANDSASAIALGPDGSAYVTGTTASADFDTTPGSMQPAQGYKGLQAFAARLDPSGKVAWSTYIGGSAESQGKAIVVDSSGRVYMTGQTYPAGTPANSLQALYYDSTGFILVMDAKGTRALIAINGFGGSAIALDAQGNIYAAGSFASPVTTTPGAFQISAANTICAASNFGATPCFYQHIAKFDPSGEQLIYGTYLTGHFGASPVAMVVDADGSLFVVGNTPSPDYPTTPGAYQPQYLYYPTVQILVHGFSQLTSSGYITKLNASGTELIWSTFFSGSTYGNGDGITGMALDQSGNVVLTGFAETSDLPGLWTTPVASRPGTSQQPYAGFVARLSPDGVKLSPTQLLPPGNGSLATAVALRADGSAVIAPQLAAVRLSDPPRIASITDTDNTRLVRVAPGQLLTLYGTKLSPPRDAQPSGTYPTSFNGMTVTFNGMGAPILYAAGDQVNLQVPYEIAGQSEVTMQVTSQFGDPPMSESFFLGVVERQPSVLLSPANFTGPLFGADCGQGAPCRQPLALNADGTLNSSDSPAASGSTVTIFLNGVGLTGPALATGVISTSQSPLIPVPAVPCCYVVSSKVVDMDTIPGSGTSIAQVRILVSSTSSSVSVPLALQDLPGGPLDTFIIRGLSVLIWTMPAN